jgi:hypothetical protein
MTSVSTLPGPAAIRGTRGACVARRRDWTTRPNFGVLASASKSTPGGSGNLQSSRIKTNSRTRATSSSTASPPEPPRPGFSEKYSFLNLASAEFPEDWGEPGAKVRYEDSPLDLALMAWFSRKIAMAIKGTALSVSQILTHCLPPLVECTTHSTDALIFHTAHPYYPTYRPTRD